MPLAKAPTTLAQRYNAKAAQLMPEMAPDLYADEKFDRACDIDDAIFRKSEYLGGMAAVILKLTEA